MYSNWSSLLAWEYLCNDCMHVRWDAIRSSLDDGSPHRWSSRSNIRVASCASGSISHRHVMYVCGLLSALPIGIVLLLVGWFYPSTTVVCTARTLVAKSNYTCNDSLLYRFAQIVSCHRWFTLCVCSAFVSTFNPSFSDQQILLLWRGLKKAYQFKFRKSWIYQVSNRAFRHCFSIESSSSGWNP